MNNDAINAHLADAAALAALKAEAASRRADGWIGPIDAAILAAWSLELATSFGNLADDDVLGR